MVIRAATYGAKDNEHGRENLDRCDPSSTYFKQFNKPIESDTAVAKGNVSTGYDKTGSPDSTLRSHGRMDLAADNPDHGSTG